jgi:hypothetical protein
MDDTTTTYIPDIRHVNIPVHRNSFRCATSGKQDTENQRHLDNHANSPKTWGSISNQWNFNGCKDPKIFGCFMSSSVLP